MMSRHHMGSAKDVVFGAYERGEQVYATFCVLIHTHYKLLSIMVALSALVFALGTYLYKYLRPYRTVQVNCWFCNKNSRIGYEFKNSFLCPFCDQYNGFKEDGGYNRDIPGQYSSGYGYSTNVRFTTLQKNKVNFDNGFCDSCNLNQSLKVRALAEYSNRPSKDQEELEVFREQLEDIYALCQLCQAVLSQTLGKQDSWLKPKLIAWRLMQTKNKLIKLSMEKYGFFKWKVICRCSLFISVVLCLLSIQNIADPIQMKSTFEKGIEYFEIKSDAVYSFWLYLDVFISAFYLLLPKDKLKVFGFVSLGVGPLLLIRWFQSHLNSANISSFQIIFNLLNLSTVVCCSIILASSLKTSRKIQKSPKKVVRKSKRVPESSAMDNTDSLYGESIYNTPPLSVSSSLFSEKNKCVEENLDSDLLGLKISTPKKGLGINGNTLSPQNLFLGNPETKSSCSGNVIQPSKFGKNLITQSSWVAGGYWGSPQRGQLTQQNVSNFETEKPKPVFSLSRSSSQSSGFVSMFSDCPSSRSIPKLFQDVPKRCPSQADSLSSECDRASLASLEKPNVFNTSLLGAPVHRNLDNWEMLSACTASSFCSNNSQLRVHGNYANSCIHGNRSPSPVFESKCSFDNHVNGHPGSHKINLDNSYFNIGLAFFLGISLSANLFLTAILILFPA